MRNRHRPVTNFITDEWYFHYHVVNSPDDGQGCPGAWLFEQTWDYFLRLRNAGLGHPWGLVIRDEFNDDQPPDDRRPDAP